MNLWDNNSDGRKHLSHLENIDSSYSVHASRSNHSSSPSLILLSLSDLLKLLLFGPAHNTKIV